MSTPKISVVMPVYNGAKYLKYSIESILNQTFEEFEFIIINDGSSDSSKDIVSSYNDKRIIYIENSKNIGIIQSLNKGLDFASGDYIARMDSDDISTKDRFKIQYNIIEKNHNIGLCGSFIRHFGDVFFPRKIKLPVNNDKIRAGFLFGNQLAHPTVMIRNSLLKEHNLFYDENHKTIEDYGLWVRLLPFTEIVNIPKPLLKYRISNSSITSSIANEEQKKIERMQNISNVFRELLSSTLNITPIEYEIDLHLLAYDPNFFLKSRILKYNGNFLTDILRDAEKWLLKLKEINSNVGFYSWSEFISVLRDRWFHICRSFNIDKKSLRSIYKNSDLLK